MCDDLREKATLQLDRLLGTIGTSLSGVEMLPEKRALETVDLDPAASTSPKRVKTTLRETDMTTVGGLQSKLIISLSTRSVLIPTKLLNLAMSLPAPGIWPSGSWPSHHASIEWTCLHLRCLKFRCAIVYGQYPTACGWLRRANV